VSVVNGQEDNPSPRSVPPALRESRYLSPCPVCNAVIHPSQISSSFLHRSRGFPCPFCGARLHFTRSNDGRIWIISALGSGLIFHLIGRRGWDLLALALFGSIPLYLVILFLTEFFTNSSRLEHMPPEQLPASNRRRYISLNLRGKPPGSQ
jgi:hypothetical protein